MFTGIIEATGNVAAIEMIAGDMRVTINSGKLDLADVKLGDSIATNGVCLTVIALTGHGYVADVSKETLSLTNFENYQVGQTVNLEKALMPQSRLGGHLVSGHIDGIATITRIETNARATDYWLCAPAQLLKYIPYKGSVCIDGISLTVNEINDNEFKLTIVPHTAGETTISGFKVGSKVNLEVDQLARYLERLMMPQQDAKPTSSLTHELLAQAGFMNR
ncbi:riboflavin synthase [Pseudoalteromonas sp. MMG024]|uniref:riboflavin synthase n=1 Tax=Pseudoalteromonas sp. MMG024 TaxID=2909980 RepID=UPI001F26AEA8|nr:riboflavin synthase [Pseudoalteromonas sp. MMG024]MCF6456769.1 riboflavin synthase [Pseudoalteromonas sp. MMG024]